MKKVWLIAWCLFLVQYGFSQTFAEWFQQKKTQLEYLATQIAGLQVYIGLAQKGYGIYKEGLGVITDIKDGELHLHKDYFSALSSVKSGIQKSGDVEDILEWRRDMERMSERLSRKDLGADRAVVQKTLDHLNSLADEGMDQLELLITNGNYQLTDEERITKIAQVHRDMYDYYAFCKQFTGQVIEIMVSRNKEGNDIRVLQSLHDVK